MSKHPDGDNMTRELIELSHLLPGAAVLDMGAGEGEAVSLLRGIGYDAFGIDRTPSGIVQAGDMTNLPFSGSSFDGVLAECSFSVCGDAARAFAEARRVLRPGGVLMLSDVYFKSESAPALSLPYPAEKSGWERTASGLTLEKFLDRSDVWTQFIIGCVWNGLDLGDCGYLKCAGKARCGYFISIWRKTEE